MTASYEGVAKLGFGAMRLPLADPDDVTAIDIEQLKAMVDEFIAGGGTYVDTAFVYHNGASETALREALVERGTEYRWGGKSGRGIDCSGLVSSAYMQCGVLIYRDARHIRLRWIMKNFLKHPNYLISILTDYLTN